MGNGSAAADRRRSEEIRAYLEKLLASPPFAASRRRSDLLRYLFEAERAGKSAEITEYGIGLDVFGKRSSFDPRIESGVRTEMSRLRKTLTEYYSGNGRGDPWRIGLPNRGYALVVTAAAPVRRWRAWIAAAISILVLSLGGWYLARTRSPIRSVVVLPFANMTGDPAKAYLSDGVTEELTDALARIPGLRVVARTSAFQFRGKAADVRQIGKQLNVDAVVEGSLLRTGAGIRLTVQVNRSADGYHIVSQSFEGGPDELGKLASSAVLPVVAGLHAGNAAIAARHTPDPEAYDLFLKARARGAILTPTSDEETISLLNRSIARDPSFADAYASLASTYASHAANVAPEPLQYVPPIKSAAAKALELDPLSARAYAVLGYTDALFLLDWKRGQGELRNALSIMPQFATGHNWLGIVLMAQGRFPEAINELRKAEELSPLSTSGVTVGFAWYLARQYDRALKEYARVQTLHPELAVLHGYVALALAGKGAFDEALAEYQFIPPSVASMSDSSRAYVLARAGRTTDARAILARLEQPKPSGSSPDAYALGDIYAALAEPDQSLGWLAKALEARKIALLRVDPALDPVRGDPRYRELLVKAGLAD